MAIRLPPLHGDFMDTSFARPWLRLEGFAALVCAILAYHYFHLPWGWFFLLLLAPDLSMLGYAAGPRIGGVAYNLAHFHGLALALLAAGLFLGYRPALGLGLIWCAHIAMDRSLGYGFKSPDDFKVTHLGRIGRDKKSEANPT